MSLGNYGSIKQSDVLFSDVDILYSFVPNYETGGNVPMQPLFGTISSSDLINLSGIDGVYSLRLPATIFNQIGIYTVVIQPKKFETTILDCSYVVQSTNNSVNISQKGIVISNSQFQSINSLVGYCIEYFDSSGNKIRNFSRIITSANLVSLATNNNNVSQGSTSYVLDPNGTSVFLTLTGDEANLISQNTPVNLGTKGQAIIIYNTFFNPTAVEVTVVNEDISTLGILLGGNSTRDNSTGVLSYFDENNNVFKQYNLLTQKNQFNNGTIDIRQERSISNPNIDFTSIVSGLQSS